MMADPDKLQLQDLKKRIETWKNRAEMACKQGNKDLGDQALEQKRKCEDSLARLQEFELDSD